MEDDLNFFGKKDNLEKDSTKSKNNGCGTAPGNLVNWYYLPKPMYSV